VPGQVGHHHEGAAKHADQQQLLSGVVLGDLPAHLGELLVDLLGGDQGLDVHPGPLLGSASGGKR
jgi:hypothetical protein